MSIKVGDKIPASTMKVMGAKGPEDITTDAIFGGKKVLLFAVPGAFTPGCSKAHLPGYVVNADKIKAKGVDTIACMAVNDAFVMDAWGKAQNAEEILMLGDGNGDFTAALGLELDGRGFGLGTRSQRFAMLVEDGKITQLNVEPGGDIDVSSAETMMAAFPGILLAFIEFGLGTGAITAVGYVVINVGVSNGLEPRYLGNGLGLSPLVVIVSVLFWGWVLGPMGMLLSVPLTMSLKIALESDQGTRWLAVLMSGRPRLGRRLRTRRRAAAPPAAE